MGREIKGVGKLKRGSKIILVMNDGTEEVHNVVNYRNGIDGITLMFEDGTPEKFVSSTLITQVRVGMLDENLDGKLLQMNS